MAAGDRIPSELVAPTAITNVATAYFTNGGANFRTQLTGFWLCNTSASSRTVTLYKNGTGTVNQIANAIVLSANSSAQIDLSQRPLVFTGTQEFAAKQDAGTDVNIAAYGIVEQLA